MKFDAYVKTYKRHLGNVKNGRYREWAIRGKARERGRGNEGGDQTFEETDPAVWTGASARDAAGPACLIDMVPQAPVVHVTHGDKPGFCNSAA